MKSLKIFMATMFVALFSSCSNTGTSQAEKQTSKVATSPIQNVFSSVDNLKSSIVGMCFVSANDDCLIDMRRETRYKIFIRNNNGWDQFDGNKYLITYDRNNQICIEFVHMEENGADNIAYGLFTPSELSFIINRNKTLKFNDFRIITSNEAEELYIKYSQYE